MFLPLCALHFVCGFRCSKIKNLVWTDQNLSRGWLFLFCSSARARKVVSSVQKIRSNFYCDSPLRLREIPISKWAIGSCARFSQSTPKQRKKMGSSPFFLRISGVILGLCRGTSESKHGLACCGSRWRFPRTLPR